MKICELYVSSFGKLKNFSCKFNDGVNVLQKENGFGKTTLTYFIKSMFYGLQDKKRSVAENERLHYKPWNSTEKFGGYLIYEIQGKQYKIQRFFGTKQSEDTCELIELDTGKIIDTDGSLIGNKIFEIDEEGFLSTTFLSQNDLSVYSNASITAKYNSFYQTDNCLDYEKSLNKIKDKIKEYKNSANRGKIIDVSNQISGLEQTILSAQNSVNVLNDLKAKELEINKEISQLDKEISALESNYEKASRQETLKVKKAQFDELVNEINFVQNSIDNNKQIFAGNNVTKERLNVLKDCYTDYKNQTYKRDLIKEDLDKLSSSLTVQDEDAKNPKPIFKIVGLILVLLSIGGLFVNVIIALALFLLGVLSVIYGFSKPKSNNNEGVNTLLFEKQNQLSQVENMISTYDQTIKNFLYSFNLNDYEYQTAFAQIEKAYNDLESLNKQKESLTVKLNSLDYVPSKNPIEDFGDIEQILVNIKRLKNNRAIIVEEKTKLLSKIRDFEQEVNNLLFYQDEKARLEQTLEEYKRDYNTLKLTEKYFVSADENLKTKYKLPLQNAYNKYLSLLTQSAKSAEIDVDFNVKLVENGLNVKTDYYSKGYQNLFDVCKRFALIDVLFESQKPFIILDDPFSNLDKEKFELAKQTLKQFSNQYQIIYFTCHQSRGIFDE